MDINEKLLYDYLNKAEIAEKQYDAFEERVSKEVKPLYNEDRDIYKRLLNEFGYTEAEFPFNDEVNI